VSGRADRLKRLLAIRVVTEELDRSALQTALAGVSEVERTLAELESELATAKLAARVALADGQRSEWMMADAQGEVAGWDRGKLKRLLVDRAAVAGVAMKKFLESRRDHEQVKQLVQNAEQTSRVDDVRRAQVAADEWFLSMRRPEL
jgi:MarR-like DNA-binding transcriptional regulator SgrR of sgrS sRNA